VCVVYCVSGVYMCMSVWSVGCVVYVYECMECGYVCDVWV